MLLLSVYQMENESIELIKTIETTLENNVIAIYETEKMLMEMPSVLESILEHQVQVLSLNADVYVKKTIEVALDFAKTIFIFLVNLFTSTIRCFINLFMDIAYSVTRDTLLQLQIQFNLILSSIQRSLTETETSLNTLLSELGGTFQTILGGQQLLPVDFTQQIMAILNFKIPPITAISDGQALVSVFINQNLQPFIDTKPDINLIWANVEQELKLAFDKLINDGTIEDVKRPVFSFVPRDTYQDSPIPKFNVSMEKEAISSTFTIFYTIGFLALAMLIIYNLLAAIYSNYMMKVKLSKIEALLGHDTKNIKSAIEETLYYLSSPLLYRVSTLLSHNTSRTTLSVFKFFSILSFPHVKMSTLSFIMIIFLYQAPYILMEMSAIQFSIDIKLKSVTATLLNSAEYKIINYFDARTKDFNSLSNMYLKSIQDDINMKITKPVDDFRYLIGNSTQREVDKIYSVINYLSDEMEWPMLSVALKGTLQCAILNKVDTFQGLLEKITENLQLELSIPFLGINDTEYTSYTQFIKGQLDKVEHNCNFKCVQPFSNSTLYTSFKSVLRVQNDIFNSILGETTACYTFDQVKVDCTNKLMENRVQSFLNHLQTKVDLIHVVLFISILPWFVFALIYTLKSLQFILFGVLLLVFKVGLFLLFSFTHVGFIQYRYSRLQIYLTPYRNRLHNLNFLSIFDRKMYQRNFISFRLMVWNKWDGFKIRLSSYFQ